MKTWVLYYSKSGNTKKIADAIAEELDEVLKSEQIPPAYPPENVSLLFLGTGEYAGKPDPKMVEFIRTLNSDRVKNAAVFGTSAGGAGKAINAVKTLLKEKGINVVDESFSCRGKFLLSNRKKPDEADIQNVKGYAKKVYDSLKS